MAFGGLTSFPPHLEHAVGLSWVILAGVVAAGANLLGVWLVRRKIEVTQRYTHDIIAFAAGVMIGGALLHFGPEISHHAPNLFSVALASFVALYLVEHHFAPHFHAPHAHHHAPPSSFGLATAIGFAFHAMFDGLAIGVGYAFAEELGLVAAIAVLVHEIPEGITTFTALIHSQFSRKTATLIASGIALITPATALLAFTLLHDIDGATLGFFLALTFGSLIYIGATDLLPEAAHQRGWRKSILFLLGIALMWSLTLLGHTHGAL